ncbi:hypothetical protein M3Y96_00859400 [Aphelenchoides besseyi]|nr:hypothetical protein M3Y96_00859400 [Aphelenchoides besseyi]
MGKLPLVLVLCFFSTYVHSLVIFLDKQTEGFTDYNNDNTAYMTDYQIYPFNLQRRPGDSKESKSFPIMQVPIKMTNPIWSLISRASSIYRDFRRHKKSVD